MEKHTVEMVKEAKRKLEDRYCVRISDGAFDLAVQGLRTFDSKLIFDDASPEKGMEILEGACKLVFDRFKNCAYESAFYEKAYQLRWALVELIELNSKRPAGELESWMNRMRWERDCASIFMNDFLCRWDLVVKSSSAFAYSTQEYADKLSSSQMSHQDFVRLLNDIRADLICCFSPLLTVKRSDVAEVASNLTDVPSRMILLPSQGIDYQKQKAINMTNLRVVNQQRAVGEIYETLASSPRSSSCSTRPRGSFLLLGQSGVGKTEIAKAVAEHWYCDASRLVEIDMSDYADEPSVLWGRLSEVVAKRPYSVILLDKIDKASPSVTRALVDVLSNKRNSVDLSNSIVFMTSGVGSDQLELLCWCHIRNEDNYKLFLHNPRTFYKTHECILKGSGSERALIEARKFFSADVLDSVDKVLTVKSFCYDLAALGLLLRETVREVYGQRMVVHVSRFGRIALSEKARSDQFCEEGGKELKRSLLEHVVPGIPAGQDLNNVVVYVDMLAGTRELLFSICRHEQSADDWYLKLKDGMLDKYIANLRTKVESAGRIFKLRSEYLGDLLDCNEGSPDQLLVDDIRSEILIMRSPFQEATCDIYRDITEARYPSSWVRQRRGVHIRRDKEEEVPEG